MKTRKKTSLILLLIIMILCSFSHAFTAAAESANENTVINKEAETSLTVEFYMSDTAIPGAKIDIWKVGEFNASLTAELTGVFAEAFNPGKVSGHDGWDTLAANMRDYVDKEGIEPLDSKITDNKGRAEFGVLEKGLYLVVGRDTEHNGNQYRSLPFLVSLPNYIESDTGKWVFDVTARPKPGSAPIPDTGVMWQPVFVLIGIGILTTGIGLAVMLIGKKNDG